MSLATPARDFLLAAQSRRVLNKIASAPSPGVQSFLAGLNQRLKTASDEDDAVVPRGDAVKRLTTRRQFRQVGKKAGAGAATPPLGLEAGGAGMPDAAAAGGALGPDVQAAGMLPKLDLASQAGSLPAGGAKPPAGPAPTEQAAGGAPAASGGMLSGLTSTLAGAGGRAADTLGLGDAFRQMPEWGQAGVTAGVPAAGLLGLLAMARRPSRSNEDDEDDEE